VRDDGTVACWGGLEVGQGLGLDEASFVKLSADRDVACGLAVDGSVSCWGEEWEPRRVGPYLDVDAGSGFECGIRTDLSIECWNDSSPTPAGPPPPGSYTQVAVGSSHACALATDGTIACWGNSFAGETTPPPGVFDQVVSGVAFSCGLRPDGTIECWGENDDGQSSPPAGAFEQLTAFRSYACARRADGSVECWGDNLTPAIVPPPPGAFVDVSAGTPNACGVRTDGSLACWGDTDDPVAETPDGIFASVATADDFACALHADGRIECWGSIRLAVSKPCVVCGDAVVDPMEECDDGNVVAGDGCSSDCYAECSPVPLTGCRSADRSKVQIRDSLDDGKDTVRWTWKRGDATTLSELTDPTGDGRYNLCLYRDGTLAPAEIALPRHSGWRPDKKGYRYEDRSTAFGGAASILLAAGEDGKAAVVFKGRGVATPDALVPATSYTVQLVDVLAGTCWESVFASGVFKNGVFKARASGG
jgi:cysteine-rich repeat protein